MSRIHTYVLCLVWGMLSQVLLAQEQQLIVFYQEADQHFLENTLPKVQAYAVEKGIELVKREVEHGLPAEITATPAIIYQNAKGRSIYASRYMEFSTIENFIRTSGVVPQKRANIQLEKVFIWENGRTLVAAPLKITDVQGKTLVGFNEAEWRSNLITNLEKSFQRFSLTEIVSLSRTDRQFYLDIHPYFQKDGKLWLSMEIYSQYNCKNPIYSNFGQPLDSVKEVVSTFEQEVLKAVTASQIGDAFSPVSDAVEIKSWEELGLALPEVDQSTMASFQEAPELPTSWVFGQALEEDIPIVQFRFRAPLDRYIGEIKKIDGSLNWDADTKSLQGQFIADMQSLTMGMESFDYNVLNKYVKAYRFPNSSFEFSSQVAVEEIAFGETLPLRVKGIFELMRKKEEVEVVAQLTPVLDEAGNPLLMVSASFELNVVDDFRIKGPDGPDPARKMMEFDLNFLMKASQQLSAKP